MVLSQLTGATMTPETYAGRLNENNTPFSDAHPASVVRIPQRRHSARNTHALNAHEIASDSVSPAIAPEVPYS